MACRSRLLHAQSYRVVVLDYTTNGDVTDLSAPIPHAAFVAQRVQEL